MDSEPASQLSPTHTDAPEIMIDAPAQIEVKEKKVKKSSSGKKEKVAKVAKISKIPSNL